VLQLLIFLANLGNLMGILQSLLNEFTVGFFERFILLFQLLDRIDYLFRPFLLAQRFRGETPTCSIVVAFSFAVC